MSRQFTHRFTSSEFFSHYALALTFRLLRPTHPELARLIQQTLDQIHFAPFESYQGLHTGEMHFNQEVVKLLNPHQVGQIVSALTHVGEVALMSKKTSQNYINLLRGLIEDWVQLTEWILMRDQASSYRQHLH